MTKCKFEHGDIKVLHTMINKWNNDLCSRSGEYLFNIVKYAEGCNAKIDIKISMVE